ncbi:unnamed protein product [Dovyalis caffra]|uniref:Uncharacterized protein n=1 Tax=Dovyalis caffra TaxID=77055 RepID=A0AAV1S0T5_9ROSI|nr:unnamed protein product [Dovyalis caffra]
MASSILKLPSCLSLNIKPSYKRTTQVAMQVRAQRFRDEGKSSNIVDANLSVLRERIEEVKIKERFERCCKSENGWNYAPGYNYMLKKEVGLVHQFIDLVVQEIHAAVHKMSSPLSSEKKNFRLPIQDWSIRSSVSVCLPAAGRISHELTLNI